MNLAEINLAFVDRVFESCAKEHPALIHEILSYNSDIVDIHSEDERAFPGNKKFLESGWYKMMLKRYFFSGSYLCKDKQVVDTCCGLGWGTYIIARFAGHVTAFDMNSEVIEFCRKTWKAPNITWLTGNALDISFLGEKRFDVALGMETIEHFSKINGENYVAQIPNILKSDGLFVGTSYFPATREIADEECKRNAYHKYIFTDEEIVEILSRFFKEYVLINRWMFVAKK